MPRTTLALALRHMRFLSDTNTTRLSGVRVRHTLGDLPTHAWPGELATNLRRLVDQRQEGVVEAQTPEYVVCSHGVPVLWLTAHAHLIRPSLDLTSHQRRHQRLASQALANPHRLVLLQLADERDLRDGRRWPTSLTSPNAESCHLRLAPVADPTDSRWIEASADEPVLRARAIQAAGGPFRLLSASGLGEFGQFGEPLTLPILAAIHTAARRAGLPPRLVGAWAVTPLSGPRRLTPAVLLERFDNEYVGLLPGGREFAPYPWGRYLTAADLAEWRDDVGRTSLDPATEEVYALGHGDRVAVFRRRNSP